MADKHTRRDFLTAAGSFLAVGLAAPGWLGSLARSGYAQVVAGKAADARRLVVVQLSGGNDGLNTVVPIADGAYHSARPTLALAETGVLPLDGLLALHPALAGLKQVYEAGQAAIVSGVGYPNPERSHFRSMDIWHQGDPAATRGTGWLGRWLDALAASGKAVPLTGINLGSAQIPALRGKTHTVPTIASLADAQRLVGSEDSERTLRALQAVESGDGAALAGVAQETTTALNALDALNAQLGAYAPSGEYPDTQFGNGFKQIAHLLGACPETRLVYFARGGFDTHANQADEHAALLGEFGGALVVFMAELAHAGLAGSTAVLVFSEFGRRVAENGSAGTDHGAAGPVLLLGGSVRAGLHGEYPSLADLERGDLKHTLDFRAVYADVLGGWLGADSEAILGGKFKAPGLFG